MAGVILWGSSGHAKVLLPVIKGQGLDVIAFVDRRADCTSLIKGVPIFRDYSALETAALWGRAEDVFFAVAIGGAAGQDRIELHNKLMDAGHLPLTLVHHRAWVADTVCLDGGVQVLGMAAVSEDARIGTQSIINTSASVDHECVIGRGCHVMPGATLAGCVQVGDFATIGSNATILPRIKIGKGAVIGAGAVVTKDVDDDAVVAGVPARSIKK